MTDLSGSRFTQETPSNPACGLRAALDIIEGKWKPLILWHLLSGPRRYGILRREIAGVSEKVLLEQLRQLEADGIVARAQLSRQPLAVVYALTARGESFVPALAHLSAWGYANVIPPAP